MKSTELDDLRPTTLEDYIGQEQIKDLLTTAILSAKGRKKTLDHVLLNGPPGLGKTTLANIIVKMMDRNIKTIIGPSLGGPRDVVKLILMLPLNTDLFIDEIHRVRKPTQEVFYPLLEDGVLFSSLSAREIAVPPLTIIGATTNIGKLEQPFIDRFGLQFQLEYYNTEELAEIIWNSAEKLGLKMNHEIADAVASRSRGTPRIANNILKRIRDYSVVLKLPEPTGEFAEMVISKKLHIDELGLKPLDYRYLRVLSEHESMGISTIASIINEEMPTLEDFVEPYLLKLGFIQRERAGRCLTEMGRKFIMGKASEWK